MKLISIFLAALLTMHSCPSERKADCENFRLELDDLLILQDNGKYVSYVDFDSLKTTVEKNIDCIVAIDLDNLKNFFPDLQKSKAHKQKFNYFMAIANIQKGDILIDMGDISYTSVKFQIDTVDLNIQDVEVTSFTKLEEIIIRSQ